MAEYYEREIVSAMLERLQKQFDACDNVDAARACIIADIELGTTMPADVRPVVRGEWLMIDGCACCSACKNNYKRAVMRHANFCPNCGADMRGGTE